MTLLDTPFVRSLFPAFAAQGTAENAYFNHDSGSFACLQVQGRLARFYRTRKVEPFSPYAPAIEAGEEMTEAQVRLAGLLGVGADEVHFGPSTSMNVYVLAQAFGDWLKPGDAIVVTDQDHEANSGVWRNLGRRGIEVREWQVDRFSGHLPLERLAALLDEKVRLVCFPHASSLVGEINPVAEICAMARTVGALTSVDGAGYAPHGLPDLGALGADIYLFSGYKTFGPHQGIMVVRRTLAEFLPNQGYFFNSRDLSRRLCPAGPDPAQIAACAGIADYYGALHRHHFRTEAEPASQRAGVFDLMRKQEMRLAAPVVEFLSRRNSVRMLGPRDLDARTSSISLVSLRPAADLQAKLAQQGVMTGAGRFNSVRTLRALDIEPERGVLRLSLFHYNSNYEVERLIGALDRAI